MAKDYWVRERIRQIKVECRGNPPAVEDFLTFLNGYNPTVQRNQEDRESVSALLEYLPFAGYELLGKSNRGAIIRGVDRGLFSRNVVLGAQRFYEFVFDLEAGDVDSDHTLRNFFNNPIKEKDILGE